MTEQREVVVVGGGQAGLSISWHLVQQGVDHVVLERDTVAHEWRDSRWDSFTLVTPNWQCTLPGYSYAGDDPDGFMTREQTYDFVRGYAESFPVPLREGVTVTSVHQAADGGFDVDTTAGPIHCRQVVVATGGYHLPVIPRLAERLPASLVQLHSSQYKSADALPPGEVLVVGNGQSGAQIAEDLMLSGRTVHLVTGSAPRVARFYRGRDCVAWLHDMGTYDVSIAEHPGGLAKRENTNHYVTGRDGGRDIDLRDFARRGMKLYGRLLEVTDDTLQLAPTLGRSLDAADQVMESIKDSIDAHIERAGIDAPTEPRYQPVWTPEREVTELRLDEVGVTSVVWSIGFRTDYRWLHAGVFDGEGRPCHQRGVTAVDGLYFLGLPWQHTWGSGRFAGVARDAAHLAEQILAAAPVSAAPVSPLHAALA
ncbi:MSMEG_0569 family flavin-dependent oxidoreductase [Rhodococcus sp. X156]|uniref:MSMEG_0569 family flavin-dependent oxidoreductase n=1 Tax=Rhodococcus sp. X156 TaxID=2499145 RepID=UPI000FD7E755|nr:MSMEG_0569 family flavin-dependent oxidoreductase [Rhodococcus sp. X156]